MINSQDIKKGTCIRLDGKLFHHSSCKTGKR